jgi:hypothetical protein
MKAPIMAAVAALVLLGACAQGPRGPQTSMSQDGMPPSNFQSVGSCEPTAWVGLYQDAQKLSPDRRAEVERLLDEAQSHRADENRGQCLYTLQHAERIVRQGARAS